jgi:hypothetical protein
MKAGRQKGGGRLRSFTQGSSATAMVLGLRKPANQEPKPSPIRLK